MDNGSFLDDLLFDLKDVPYCLVCVHEAIEQGIVRVEDIEYEVEWKTLGEDEPSCPRCGRVFSWGDRADEVGYETWKGAGEDE